MNFGTPPPTIIYNVQTMHVHNYPTYTPPQTNFCLCQQHQTQPPFTPWPDPIQEQPPQTSVRRRFPTLEEQLLRLERNSEAQVIRNVMSENEQHRLFRQLQIMPPPFFSTFESDRGLPESLSQAEFDRLQREVCNDDIQICAICTEYFGRGVETVVLPCDHRFHTHCSQAWLLQNRSCPLCRQTVVIQQPQSNNDEEEEKTIPMPDDDSESISDPPSIDTTEE